MERRVKYLLSAVRFSEFHGLQIRYQMCPMCRPYEHSEPSHLVDFLCPRYSSRFYAEVRCHYHCLELAKSSLVSVYLVSL